jgi:hypothetical protein
MVLACEPSDGGLKIGFGVGIYKEEMIELHQPHDVDLIKM